MACELPSGRKLLLERFESGQAEEFVGEGLFHASLAKILHAGFEPGATWLSSTPLVERGAYDRIVLQGRPEPGKCLQYPRYAGTEQPAVLSAEMANDKESVTIQAGVELPESVLQMAEVTKQPIPPR